MPARVLDHLAQIGRAGKVPGRQDITIHGARLFVLPNPSGRNANYSYAEMLEAFRGLKRELVRSSRGGNS